MEGLCIDCKKTTKIEKTMMYRGKPAGLCECCGNEKWLRWKS